MLRLLPGERLEGLGDVTQGLTSEMAAARRARYGTNRIVETPPNGWLDLGRDTLRDPMIWFLVATALLFVWTGDYAEAAVLVVAIMPIVGMDAYLHRRTQASTEGLVGRLATKALVLRDGTLSSVSSDELVPGDLAVVEEGQPFPADGLIVGGRELQADESSLTGEAMPVRKTVLARDLRIEADRSVEEAHWGYAGTRLLTGRAQLCVIFTGGDTLYGEIVRSARTGSAERTPLQRAIGSLVFALIVVASIVCIGLAATRYLQGHGMVDALISAVTLAIAALPEEFPVVFTFFLGVGVYRLARRQALVRRAVVVEHIGRVTCICSDKTGTLTEGRLRLAHVVPRAGLTENELRRAAARASRAASADPLDQAILSVASAAPDDGIVVATFPFTEDRRRETSVRRKTAGQLVSAVKGAPETVLGLCDLEVGEREIWLGRAHNLAASGHKVIACGERSLDAEWSGDEPGHDFVFQGLLAFEDPVRPGVAEAVVQALNAGIRVVMITGDHPATARAIAVDLGIGGGHPRVIRGEDLASTIERNEVGAVDVVARAMPAVKLDLVRELQRLGEVVAVTGDGVNDVPALQAANIGIAMGERGTRSAREAASIVLLDDNFRTIVRAISEGRQLFRNLRLSFAYLMMIHIPLVATAAVLPFMGFPLLYLPVHIVWLELIIHPTALLVFQQLPAGPLERAARMGKTQFFGWKEWWLIGLIGTATCGLILLGYVQSLGEDHSVEHARAMALAALVVASAAITAGMSRLRTRASVAIVASVLASAVAFVQVPMLAEALHLAPLHLGDWQFAVIGGGLVGVLAVLFSSGIGDGPFRRGR